MDAFGVDAEIKSTLNKRVDLPSGGYLIFDYAEAFTVVDVNTGRFVGGRGKNSNSRLEDTITKNNLEAVKEVVRQLRLRDIGGIIVIDFIDMANPKNRQAVEEALRSELERDRTKTYVVEISPLGLVEMTRQNVTDGPRELMTKKCPTCGGDGIVVSETTAAVEIERRLRALVTPGSRTQAFRVEVNAKIASLVVGPGATRLAELEETTRRSFFLVGKEDVHLDHFRVLDQGTLEKLKPEAPVEAEKTISVKLGEVDRHDALAAVAHLDGYAVVVAGAANLVGKTVKARIERVLDGIAYATLASSGAKTAPEPITAEAEAERPTRARKTTRRTSEPDAAAPEAEAREADEDDDEQADAVAEEPEADDRRRRRGRDGDGRAEEADAPRLARRPQAQEARRGSRRRRDRRRRRRRGRRAGGRGGVRARARRRGPAGAGRGAGDADRRRRRAVAAHPPSAPRARAGGRRRGRRGAGAEEDPPRLARGAEAQEDAGGGDERLRAGRRRGGTPGRRRRRAVGDRRARRRGRQPSRSRPQSRSQRSRSPQSRSPRRSPLRSPKSPRPQSRGRPSPGLRATATATRSRGTTCRCRSGETTSAARVRYTGAARGPVPAFSTL